MRLDDRLTACAELVRRGSRMADIGTDHAHLPVYLVENGVCPGAVASDIRPGPAAAARRTVEQAGLTDKIVVRVGDGLAPLQPGECGDIVIAGMGGETIAAILSVPAWIREGGVRLILQPMTRAEALHRFLLANGFAIGTETVVRDGTHLYPVLSAAYTGERLAVPSPAQCIIGGLGREGEAAAYLLKQRQILLKKAEGLRGADPGQAAACEETAAAVEEYLRRPPV